MIEERIKRERLHRPLEVSRKHSVLMATTHVSASSARVSDVGVHVASCCSPSTSADVANLPLMATCYQNHWFADCRLQKRCIRHSVRQSSTLESRDCIMDGAEDEYEYGKL